MAAKPQSGDDDGFSTSSELSGFDHGHAQQDAATDATEAEGFATSAPSIRSPYDDIVDSEPLGASEEISKYFKEMVERGLITQEESELLVRRLRRSRRR